MKRSIAIVLIGMLLSGCGPSVQEQWAARMQALQMDLDSAQTQWKAEVDQRRFRTNAEAMRELASRYDGVYARWGFRADAFSQALMAYAVALAERVDKRDISQDEANRLLNKLHAETERARRELALGAMATREQRSAAMIQWWNGFWSRQQETYQATPADPVRCMAMAVGVEGKSIECH